MIYCYMRFPDEKFPHTHLYNVPTHPTHVIIGSCASSIAVHNTIYDCVTCKVLCIENGN